MCLIINFKPEFEISKELMADFAKRNDDGFGIMWIQDNRLCHEKYGPEDMEKLYPLYLNLRKYEGYIHTRMRTHGATNQDMAHPFNCGFGIYLMHNGILTDKGEDTSKSDTWHFVNKIVAPLFQQSKNPHKLIRSSAFNDLVHKYIGFSNRIVIGDRGGFIRFNEGSWHKITNKDTGVVGMLVSNEYAWSASQFGKPERGYYGHKYGFSCGIYQDPDEEDEHVPAPTTRKRLPLSSHLFPTIDKDKLDEFLKNHFFHLRGPWYVDTQTRVYRKRLDAGLDRRADLDDNEQFWKALPEWTCEKLGNWVAERQKEMTPGIKTPPKKEETTPKASQLALNWGFKSADQIREDLTKYPDQAAEAVVALTHEHVKQYH